MDERAKKRILSTFTNLSDVNTVKDGIESKSTVTTKKGETLIVIPAIVGKGWHIFLNDEFIIELPDGDRVFSYINTFY